MIATRNGFHTRLGLIAALAVTAIVGCKKPGGVKADDKAAGAVAAAGADTVCTKWADALCEKAGGAESPTCASIKTTASLLPTAACQAGLADLDYSTKKLAGLRKVCDELVAKLCGEIGKDTPTCEMVTTQTAKFPPERCQGMMENYGQVLAQLQQMEAQRVAREKPLSQEQQDKIAAADAPAFGPKDAKVTIVEFSDFQCPYCTKAADAVTGIKKKYGDKVRLVFRQFPLGFHQDAHKAAQAALAAAAQGKFWEFHDILFANQSALGVPDLEKYAQKAGLNVGLFKKALKDEKYKGQVDADMKLGEEVAVNGTPTMFLNGKRVANSTAVEAISELIDKELGTATN